MNREILVKPTVTIKEALKKLDKTAERTLIVVDEKKRLLGTITDGDIRRFILKTGKIEGNISDIYNRNPIYLHKDTDSNTIKEIFLRKRIEVLPVINDKKEVIDYVSWTKFFSEKRAKIKKKIDLNIPVVIMAGGKGTRLRPFTEIIPKPLIPIGEKTMIEHIIDHFKSFGIREFYLTINYKGKLIEAYFENIVKDYNIEFVWEDEFLGTAGSLKLIEDKVDRDFIVSNCDVLVRANLSDVLIFHKENNSLFTSITSIKHYKIPYGVVEIVTDGKIKEIKEKPEFTFQINTGVYVMKREVLKYIPKDKYFDMPELIKILIENEEKVLAYPVNESDYIDMGQWDEYKEALAKIEGFYSV